VQIKAHPKFRSHVDIGIASVMTGHCAYTIDCYVTSHLVICHLQKLRVDIASAFAFCIEVELVITAVGTCNCTAHNHCCKTLHVRVTFT